jgi:hypothetical protein
LKISYWLLQGHLGLGADPNKSEIFFQTALKSAFTESWSYFIGRALFGLACRYENNDPQQSQHLCSVIKSIADAESNPMLVYLVNSRFPDAQKIIRQPVSVDRQFQTIKIGSRQFSFRSRPKMFDFVDFLL